MGEVIHTLKTIEIVSKAESMSDKSKLKRICELVRDIESSINRVNAMETVQCTPQ